MHSTCSLSQWPKTHVEQALLLLFNTMYELGSSLHIRTMQEEATGASTVVGLLELRQMSLGGVD